MAGSTINLAPNDGHTKFNQTNMRNISCMKYYINWMVKMRNAVYTVLKYGKEVPVTSEYKDS